MYWISLGLLNRCPQFSNFTLQNREKSSVLKELNHFPQSPELDLLMDFRINYLKSTPLPQELTFSWTSDLVTSNKPPPPKDWTFSWNSDLITTIHTQHPSIGTSRGELCRDFAVYRKVTASLTNVTHAQMSFSRALQSRNETTEGPWTVNSFAHVFKFVRKIKTMAS